MLEGWWNVGDEEMEEDNNDEYLDWWWSWAKWKEDEQDIFKTWYNIIYIIYYNINIYNI